MNTRQFKDAISIAISNEPLNEDISKFNGFALLGFKPIYCTLKELAYLIRWQAVYLSGGLDNESLQEIRANKNRFIVVS